MKRSKITKRILAVVLSLTLVMSNMTVSATDFDEDDTAVVETVSDVSDEEVEDVTEIEEAIEESTDEDAVDEETDEVNEDSDEADEIIEEDAEDELNEEETELVLEENDDLLITAYAEEIEAVSLDDSKITVFDFGAAALDENTYNNVLTAEVINSWYPGVDPGTNGKNIESFEVKDTDGNVILAFNDGGNKAAHRLRSTNKDITRYDEKSLKNKAGDTTYAGYIYSNKAATDKVYLQVAVKKGDVVTVAAASNGTDSKIVFKAPSGDEQSYVHTLGSSTVSEIEFYATEEGAYTLYSADEKLVVARISVEHTQLATVTGKVNAPDSLKKAYSVVFTNQTTKEVAKAEVKDGKYSVELTEGYDYEVSLDNANGYIITSDKIVSINATDNHQVEMDIEVSDVELVKIKGEIKGLSTEVLNKAKITLNSDKTYIPEIKYDGLNFTVQLEKGVKYEIVAEGIDDYELQTTSMEADTDSNIDIIFSATDTYMITIDPVGASLADLADAEFIFTRHDNDDVSKEENYKYTFIGTNNIKLRNGVYTVVVKANDFTQKITSNLVVKDAPVTKTIKFDFTGDAKKPVSWSFTSKEYTGQTEYNGLTVTNGTRHSDNYGMMIKNGSVEIPVKGNSVIKVGVGYTWDLSLGEKNYLQTSDGGMQTVEFEYTGEAGKVILEAGSKTTSYVSSITVTPVSDVAAELPTAWDFRKDNYTGQAEFDGLEISGGKKHGNQYGMMIGNGFIKVPVNGSCTVKVSVGYNWDITINGFQGEDYKDKTNSGDKTLVYEYEGPKGKLEISVGSEFSSYIKSIELVYAVNEKADDIEITVGSKNADYKTVNEALDAVRRMNRKPGQRAVISIEPGDYEEMLVVDVPNVTLKNASKNPSIATKNKGVDIDENAVRITSYYGHGYTYYSMGNDCKYNEELLEANKENGYPSYVNPGSGTTNGSYWNATVVINANGFEAEGIIFENSFNQYVSKKAANDIIVAQSGAKEGNVKRADMKAGDTTVQNKKYVERAAALAIANNCSEIFFDNCKFIGRQDTLYGGTNVTAAFQKCDIYGGTDYIFGAMTAVFAKCNLVANTMEDGNDTFYITAAQQKSGRGYLMYNCTVTSTNPGVDTASELRSKAGFFGRPWEANTSEVVFYATVIEEANDYTSLINPKGWNSSLSSTSDNVYEFGTYEMMANVDNTKARESWAKTFDSITDAKLADGSAVTFATFLGDWQPFDADMETVVYPTTKVEKPVEDKDDTVEEEKTYVFDAAAETSITSVDKKAAVSTSAFGTDKFFIHGGTGSIRSNSGTFSLELAKNKGSYLEFTITGIGKATIKVSSTSDSNSTIFGLYKNGVLVENTVKATSITGSKATAFVYNNLEAGTYQLVSNDSRGLRVYAMEVTNTPIVDEKTVSTFFDAKELTVSAKEGTEKSADNVFTVIYGADSKVEVKAVTINNFKSTNRINFGGKTDISTFSNTIKFTVAEKYTTVNVFWQVGADGRSIAILDAQGKVVEAFSETTKKDTRYETKFTLEGAGTYYIANMEGKNYFFGVGLTNSNVKAQRADWDTVEAPSIVSAADDNAGKIKVTVKGLVGYDGADELIVTMMDLDGNVLSSDSINAEGSEHIAEFTPTASGDYRFVAKLVRGKDEKTSAQTGKISFVLPLVAPGLKSATNKGNRTVEVEWDAVDEATSYIVTVDGEEYKETNDLKLIVKDLTIGQEYTFGVKAVREDKLLFITTGKEKTAIGTTIKLVVKDAVDRTWAFSAYGSSTDSKNNGYKGNINDGSVTVYSEGGKGKIVPGSTDGLAYYYTTIDPEKENFTITADVHVDNWTLSNGQEGFGIMASDTVGKNGDGTAFWNNNYQLISSKIEYYHDGKDVTTDTSAAKISMKLGLGYTAKLGVTAEDVASIKNGEITMPAGFTTETGTLETSAASYGGGTYNLVGNYVGTEPTGNLENLIKDFKLQLQRDNTGYTLRYLDNDGNVIMEKLYYDLEREALTQIDKDNIYVGFFASRNARITVSNMTLTTIDPKDDAPAKEREIEYVVPNYVIESATVANSEDYTLVFYGNADGVLDITDSNGNVIAKAVNVKANTKAYFDTKLAGEETTFIVVMTPDENYVPGEYKKLSNYAPHTLKHEVSYKKFAGEYIYVSANGKYDNTGASNSPVDIYTAVKYVAAGQTIVLAAENYNLTRTVKVERGINGTSDSPIRMISDPNSTKRAVFNFGKRCAGMILAGDYWYFKGFDVTKSADAQKGIQVSGNNNTLDQINAYMNGNTGIQISRLNGTDEFDQWPADNLILNCTSYLNADKGYEDADGFAAKLTVGNGNVFDGCIAAYNADDGWDLFAKVQSGSIGAVTIQNCVTYKNGYVLTVDGKKYSEITFDGIETDAGNGNGFKMGGDSMPGAHVLKNSIAFANKAKGFDSNSCPDIKVYNSTSFNNESYNVAFYTNTAVNTDFFADGVLSFKTSNSTAENIKLLGKQDKNAVYGATNFYVNGKEDSSNADGTKVSADWFKSLTYDKSVGLYGISRNADGTINMNGFLELTDKAPAGVGARMPGKASSDYTAPAETVTNNDASSNSNASNSSQTETTTATVSTSNAPFIAANVDIEKVNGIDTITTVIDRDFILRMKTYELYHSQMINVMVNIPGLVGVSFMTNEVPIGAKDINLTYTKSKVEGFAAGFDTYKYTFKYPVALQFKLVFHMNMGIEYIGKAAYIFVYNTKTKQYEIKSTMFVNEIGNVAVSLDELSRVMVLIAE